MAGPKGRRRTTSPAQGSLVARRLARGRLRERRTRTMSGVLRIVLISLIAVFLGWSVLGVGAAAASAVAVSSYLESLPQPDAEINQREAFRSVRILDRNGILLYELWDQQNGRRSFVKLSELPPHLVWATLATEDANFYTNPGFDALGIARAAYQDITKTGQSGGSTITQQLIRNVLFDLEERYDRSYQRKAKEIVLAWRLNQIYSKDRILEMYLNEIYYGNISYGVEAAAIGYFGKSAREVSLAESAMIAGLAAAPVSYDPRTNPQAAKDRQEYVLDLMVRHGFIDEDQADEAKAQDLVLAPPTKRDDIKAPHFVNYVRDVLLEKYGPRLYRSGFQVYTTLDYRLQETSERIVKEHIERIRRYKATNAAVVVVDPKTGQILSMVGSADYYDKSIDGQVNVALAERQPGSSIKPVTYAAAFAKGWTPYQTITDSPISERDALGKLWVPHNYDDKYHGTMLVREALGNSWNIPAVKALKYVGVETMIELARKMGISSFKDPSRYGLSITLGGGELRLLDHAGAYGVFATNGIRNTPNPILRILDEQGNLVDEPKPTGARVMTAEVAYLITDTLSDPQARRVTYGLGGPLKTSRLTAAKTGTTDDHRDGWTMGYTPNIVVGVWVGNSDNTPMAGLFGSSSAMPIWHDIIEESFSYVPDDKFVRPSGIVEGRGCNSRDTETGECTGYGREIYIRGFEPKTRTVPGDSGFSRPPSEGDTDGRPRDGTTDGGRPATPGNPTGPLVPVAPQPGRPPNTFAPPPSAPPAGPLAGLGNVPGFTAPR